MLLSDDLQIRTCSVIVSLTSFALFVTADARATVDSTTEMLVAIGALGHLWSGPLTSLAGTRAYHTFRWWQPFEGGRVFVFLQAFGWALYGLCVLISFITFLNVSQQQHHAQVTSGPDEFKRKVLGLYSVVGFKGFTAQILLNVSIGRRKSISINARSFSNPPPHCRLLQ